MNKLKANPRIFLVISVLAILFGSWLIMTSPARKAEKSLDVARQLVLSQEQELEKFNVDFQDDLAWYKSEYTSPITVLIFSCQDQVSLADKEIKLAEEAGRSKEKRKHADEAQKIVQTIALDLAKAQEQISIFEKMTARARKSLEQVNNLVPEAVSKQSLADRLIVERGPKYPSKYFNLNQEKLNQVQSNLSVASEARQSAYDLLPMENGSEHLGDPNGALEFIKVAEDNIASAKSNAVEIIKNFDFYLRATTEAKPSIDSSKQKLATASNYLDSLVARGPLQQAKALKIPFADIAKANNLLSEAVVALETLTDENKYDFPSAYAKALEAFKLAESSVAEADRQVALFSEAIKLIKQLRTAIAGLEKNIGGAKAYQNQLANHSQNAWSGVAGNINTANGNYEKAKGSLSRADNFISNDQAYEKALVEIQNSLALINQSEGLISAFIQLTKTLEDYRSDWPSVERQAKKAINDEESNIDSYGSYDSSAQSDFDSAESYLSSARSSAGNREYQEAVDKAKEAIRLASGTGDQAYQAYLAHKKRQEDIASSFDFDSPSSSSSDSGWGGGFDSGSSSSGSGWGGGSSSDSSGWGGSSSSDSGGWGGSSSSSSDGGGWD